MPPPIRILILSSELHNRLALADILNREHWETICASTVNEFQEVLERRNVTLVFCDRQLSDGTYRDVLQTMRSLSTNVPLVVISRLADWDEYLEVLQEGAFDLIASPCRLTDVTWVVLRAQHEYKKRRAPIGRGKAYDDVFSQEPIRAEDQTRINGRGADAELRSKARSA
jgi:DNA-binding NtrC family response regulator